MDERSEEWESRCEDEFGRVCLGVGIEWALGKLIW